MAISSSTPPRLEFSYISWGTYLFLLYGCSINVVLCPHLTPELAMAGGIFLAQEEVINGFYTLISYSLGAARSKGLLNNEWMNGGDETDNTIVGPRLCLYHVALQSNTGTPSVLMPYFRGGGGIQKRLHSATCPPEFHRFFTRWAGVVPHLKYLTKEQQNDLEWFICNKTPVPLPPSLGHIRWIVDDLWAVAAEISQCQSFQARYGGPVHATSNVSAPTGPTWPAANPPLYNYPTGSGPTMPYPGNHAGPHETPHAPVPYYPGHGPPSNMPGPPFPLHNSPPGFDNFAPPPPGHNTGDQGDFVGGFAPSILTRSSTVRPPATQPLGLPAPASPLFRRHTIPNQPTQNDFPTMDYPISSAKGIEEVIGSNMPAPEIIARLCRHGCRNLSGNLDLSSCTDRPISRGGFGEIYWGKLYDGTKVAIKTPLLLDEFSDQARKCLKHTARELHTWSKCKHPNVTRLLGLAEFRGQIAMISPWMENGDLRGYVNKYPNVDRFSLCVQLAEGLAYLHSIEIIHGDLKGDNALVSSEGTVTLTDFGNAILPESTLRFTQTATSGNMTMRWTAPEILHGGKCSPPADVYALGMTMLEVFTGQVPYFGKAEQGVFLSVGMKKEIPTRPVEHFPFDGARGDMLWNLFVNCWLYNPEERPTADAICDILRAIAQQGSQWWGVPVAG